ncbi:MAG TPA: response regulator [Elainellaceae cyanobacterium]
MTQSKQILVIDDEEGIQEVIQICLEEIAGWSVVSAYSGYTGVKLAYSHLPDAILLDISMPDMNGVEVFQTLQENPKTLDIPVILLTANFQPDDYEQLSKFGRLAGVIVKPFDPIALVTRISDLLGWTPD